MPPVAAVPLRKAVGNVQNNGAIAIRPMAQIESAVSREPLWYDKPLKQQEFPFRQAAIPRVTITRSVNFLYEERKRSVK